MPSFLIESFKGGISDYEDKGLKGAFKFGSGLNIRRKRDTLYAQQALKDDLASGTLNGRVRFIITATDGNSYWFLSSGKIYKRTSAGTWSLVYTDSEAITGAFEWTNSSGNTGIYWTTPTKIHRHAIAGNWTSDVDATVAGQTYPKSNLTSADWHTAKQVNGAIVGVNYNTLYLIGFDESYTNNALQLVPGNIAKTLIESGLDAKVGANRLDTQESSMIFIWDGSATNCNDKIQLPFANINAMIETEIGIVQYGTNGGLYFFGDATKLPITSFPDGGQVDPDGVENDNGLALFGVYGNGSAKTGIYSYGRNRKNGDFVLNLEYPLAVDEINAIKKIGTELFIAYKSGSSYGVKKVDTSNKISEAVFESIDLKTPAELQRVPTHNVAVVTMTPLPSGCSVELWRRLDKVESGGTDYTGSSTGLNDGWFQCSTQEGTGSFSTDGGTEAVFNLGDKARVLELRVVLNCTGNYSPEVYRVQSFFN